MNITRIERLDPTCLDVFGTGPRGGEINWTVHFNRKGLVHYAYQHKPAGGYHAPHATPLPVLDAARAFQMRSE